MSQDELSQILNTAKTIAVVGLSSKPERPSNQVSQYMQAQGYRVIPVNPGETEVLGERSYPELSAVPEPIDVVQIFRAPEHVPPIVDEAIRLGIKVIWMQDGAGNEEAAAKAREAGLTVVVNDCMMRQHRFLNARG